MDPFSRRSTWNLLKVRCQTHHHVTRHYRACLLNVLLGIAYVQSKAKGRIMVLTTHFMDEADLLGDRIGTLVHQSCCFFIDLRSCAALHT